MWRQARRGSSVDTWISERAHIFETNADHELEMGMDEPDPTFSFNFKSLNRALQQTLFQFHDKHRRSLNALWAARDHLEGMNAQFQEWKNSRKVPRFLSKMQIPLKVLGSRCPQSIDPRGKTFGEVTAELEDKDVDRRIEIMMQAKSAELDLLRDEASLSSYSKQVTECLDETYKAPIEMDLQDDFRKDIWINEAQKFIEASHEHLLFGKALSRSQQQQAKKKREAAIENAKHQFAQLPKDLQLDLIIESKVSSMMKGGGKANPALKQSMSEPQFAQLHRAKQDVTRDYGKFFGLNRLPHGKGRGKSNSHGKAFGRGNHGRHPASPSPARSNRTSSSRQSQAKGKGKGEKGFSRSLSRQSSWRGFKGKGKGKYKGKQSKGKGKGKGGKSTSAWRPRSRSTTPFNPRARWGTQQAPRAPYPQQWRNRYNARQP